MSSTSSPPGMSLVVAKMATSQAITKALRPFRSIGGDQVGQTKKVQVVVPSMGIEVAGAMFDEKLKRRVPGEKRLSGYQLFMQERREQQGGSSGRGMKHVFAEIGAAWRDLPEEEKEEYRARAADTSTSSSPTAVESPRRIDSDDAEEVDGEDGTNKEDGKRCRSAKQADRKHKSSTQTASDRNSKKQKMDQRGKGKKDSLESIAQSDDDSVLVSWHCTRVQDLELIFGKHNFSADGVPSAGFLCTHGQKPVVTAIKPPVEFSLQKSSASASLLKVSFTMEFKRT